MPRCVFARWARALLFLFAALAGIGQGVNAIDGASNAKQTSWQQCVLDISRIYRLTSRDTAEWLPSGDCGFGPISHGDLTAYLRGGDWRQVRRRRNSVKDRDPEANSKNFTLSWMGDSTALRAFISAANFYLNITPPIQVQRVANSPKQSCVDGIGSLANVEFCFNRLIYVSLSEQDIPRLFQKILQKKNLRKGSLVVLTLGNWDLNWQLQLNMPMPLLNGPVQNWPVAKAYWTKHVERLFALLNDTLLSIPLESRPLVVIREQYQPNCESSRFTHPKRRFRKCPQLIRPVVIPFYRRTMAPLAWAMNIPVIPVDELFTGGGHCDMGDGIHIDAKCIMHELDLTLNVWRLLSERGVEQGWTNSPSQREGGGEVIKRFPRPGDFENETAYVAWMAAHVANRSAVGVAAPGQPSSDSSGRPSTASDGATTIAPTDVGEESTPPPPRTEADRQGASEEYGVVSIVPVEKRGMTFRTLGDRMVQWASWFVAGAVGVLLAVAIGLSEKWS